MVPPAEQSPLLIDLVDEQTRKNINILNQKLGGLKAEIDIRLETLTDEAADSTEKERLQAFLAEVELAITRINYLKTVAIVEDMSAQEFLDANQAQLDDFKDVIEKNIARISDIKSKF